LIDLRFEFLQFLGGGQVAAIIRELFGFAAPPLGGASVPPTWYPTISLRYFDIAAAPFEFGFAMARLVRSRRVLCQPNPVVDGTWQVRPLFQK